MENAIHATILYKRMKQLGIGLLTPLEQGEQRIPPAIIQSFRADGPGAICFDLPRPYTDCSGLYPQFAAGMRFYNKALHFQVTTSGQATIAPGSLLAPADGTLHVRYTIEYAVLQAYRYRLGQLPPILRRLLRQLGPLFEPGIVRLAGSAPLSQIIP